MEDIPTRNRGVPFDYYDEDKQNPSKSHFEPGIIDLDGDDAGITINEQRVIVGPRIMTKIPVVTKENQEEVLSQIRQVLIDSGLAQ